MQLKVQDYQLPAKIDFNFEELRAELTEKANLYATVVYDDEHIKQAKADRAKLNKFKTAINEERLRREKEYMEPFTEFKNKIADILGIIQKPIDVIDKQIKEAEKKEAEEKRAKIIELFDGIQNRPSWLKIEQIWDSRWLNKGTSFRQIEENIVGWCGRIESELATIRGLSVGAYEAEEEYKRSLDLGRAVAEGQRQAEIQRKKAESEEKATLPESFRETPEIARETPQTVTTYYDNKPVEMPVPIWKPEPEPEEAAEWVNFSALLTVSKAEALRDFCREYGIEIKAI